jgi:D-sedoheptulose 7-phosphate isomerase
MNNLENAFAEVSTIGQYSRRYFSYLAEVLESVDEIEINKLGDVFESSRAKGNTIFVAGNGGSAATATTMANDIGFDIIKKTGTDKPFRLFSLVDNNSVVTAISNDVGY